MDLASDPDAIIIRDIGEGPAAAWNVLRPNERITVGDRIIQVNGLTGDVLGMVLQLAKDARVTFLIALPVPGPPLLQ